jgi:hypothetical protein
MPRFLLQAGISRSPWFTDLQPTAGYQWPRSPTVPQTTGKGTFICGNVSSCGNFTSYSPGATS